MYFGGGGEHASGDVVVDLDGGLGHDIPEGLHVLVKVLQLLVDHRTEDALDLALLGKERREGDWGRGVGREEKEEGREGEGGRWGEGRRRVGRRRREVGRWREGRSREGGKEPGGREGAGREGRSREGGKEPGGREGAGRE